MAAYGEPKTEHAFKTFAKDLKEGNIAPVIYMYGAEEYLMEWAAGALASRYVSGGAGSLDLVRPDADEVTAQDIINDCETFSMSGSGTMRLLGRTMPRVFRRIS